METMNEISQGGLIREVVSIPMLEVYRVIQQRFLDWKE